MRSENIRHVTFLDAVRTYREKQMEHMDSCGDTRGKKRNGWVEGKTDVSVVRSQLDQFSAVWPGHINKNANTLRAPKIQFGSGRAKGNPYWGVAPAGRDHSVSN